MRHVVIPGRRQLESEHEQIIEALQSRDVDRAAEAFGHHLLNLEELV